MNDKKGIFLLQNVLEKARGKIKAVKESREIIQNAKSGRIVSY